MAHTCPQCGDWCADKKRHRCPEAIIEPHEPTDYERARNNLSDAWDGLKDSVMAHVSSERHDTEVAAARKALRKMTANCRRAYQLIEGSDFGMTDAEGRECFFSFPQRRADLYRDGLVRDSGERRKTPRKADAIVWEVVK